MNKFFSISSSILLAFCLSNPVAAATYTYNLRNNAVLKINSASGLVTFRGGRGNDYINAQFISNDFRNFKGQLQPEFQTRNLGRAYGSSTYLLHGKKYTAGKYANFTLHFGSSGFVNLRGIWTGTFKDITDYQSVIGTYYDDIPPSTTTGGSYNHGTTTTTTTTGTSGGTSTGGSSSSGGGTSTSGGSSASGGTSSSGGSSTSSGSSTSGGTAVPEPGLLGLLTLGIGGLVFGRRRRRPEMAK